MCFVVKNNVHYVMELDVQSMCVNNFTPVLYVGNSWACLFIVCIKSIKKKKTKKKTS